MKVVLSAFGGIMPRLADHQLAHASATVAHDVKLRNGILEPWLTNCHFADAVANAVSFHIYGCCAVTWDSIVTAGNLPPDWKRFYIAGRNGNGLEAVEMQCDCEPVYYTGGVPSPTSPLTVSATEECSREADARSYVYTYVNKWGEESAPSPASNIVRVNDGSTVTITDFADPPDGYGIVAINLYRATTGFRVPDGKEQKFQTAFLYVTTLDVPLEEDTFEDTVLTVYLGTALETSDDRMPPAMTGVLAVKDMIRLVGWNRNNIYMSENLMPYNWPAVYDITLDHTIIHVAELDQKLYVTTDSHPYIIDISDCDPTKCSPVISVDTYLPDIGCKRANGCVITPHGLFYASPIGIVLVNGNGKWDIVTSRWFGEDEWRKLRPDTVTMAYYEGYLFFSTEMGTFLLDINADPYGNGQGTELVTLSDTPVACMVSETGALILLQDDELVVWSGGDMPREYIWRSRQLTQGDGVVGSGTPDAGRTGAAPAMGSLWSPAVVKMKGAARVRLTTPHERDVLNRYICTERPVRVSRAGRHPFYWLELRSTSPVQYIDVGTAYWTVAGGQ